MKPSLSIKDSLDAVGANTGLPPPHLFNSDSLKQRIERQILKQQKLFNHSTKSKRKEIE